MTEWPSLTVHTRNRLIGGGTALTFIGATVALLYPQGSVAVVVGVSLLLLLLWALSHHLRVLREAGIVEAERRGKGVLYRLAPTVEEARSGKAINLGCCLISFN